MSDNTEQYQWIVRLVANLGALLSAQVAFVAGDLRWYPIQVDEPPAPSQTPIEFKRFDDGFTVFYPNGSEFKDPEEALQERDQAQAKLNQA
jgi:hypothetical protein